MKQTGRERRNVYKNIPKRKKKKKKKERKKQAVNEDLELITVVISV